MTPEEHLAAILAAWRETDSFIINDELAMALDAAEKDLNS